MLSHILQSIAVLAGLVLAQRYADILAVGSPYGYAGSLTDGQIARQHVAEANLHPNITESFQLAPFYVGGVFNDGRNAPDDENIWTLRINVTDFSVPDAQPSYPSEQPAFVNPHITNTIFEFDWPQAGTFRSALNRSTQPFCVSVNCASFLPNVTNGFTSDDDIGDCEPVLGEACTNAILASGSNLRDCSFDSWTSLPECASTFGASRSYAKYGLEQTSFNLNANLNGNETTRLNVSSSTATGYEAIAEGKNGQWGFLSHSTEPYNATDTTIFDEQANRLYVVLMAVSPYQGQQGLWSTKALCMRAKTEHFEVNNGGDGDASSMSSGNIAPTLMPHAGGVGSALGLTSLGMGMFALL